MTHLSNNLLSFSSNFVLGALAFLVGGGAGVELVHYLCEDRKYLFC
jgi:hypothetical protein